MASITDYKYEEPGVKTVMDKTPMLALILSAVLICTFPAWNGVKERQNDLVNDRLALKVCGKISEADIHKVGQQLEAQLRVPVLSGPLFSKYRMIVIGPPQRPDFVDQAIKAFHVIDPSIKLVHIPIFKVGTEIQIPTGELVLQFKPEVSDEQATRKISDLNLRIVNEHIQGRPGFYVACDPRNDINKLIEIATALKKSGLVEYAQLNYLEMMR